MSCKTRGGLEAYWVLNYTALSLSHPQAKRDFENMGVVFKEIETNGYYNLTMTLPAILPLNNTIISCTVKNHGVDMSNEVSLRVFNDLSKLTSGYISGNQIQ